MEAGQELDIAVAIFESDQIRTSIDQPPHRIELEQAIVPVIDNDADSDGAADRHDMAVKPFLLRLDQIVRQQQNPVRPRLLRPPRKFDRQSRAISDARHDRQPVPSGVDRSCDDALVLGRLQRKELSGSSRREQGGGMATDEIVDVLLVRVSRERAVVGEMGDRKGQQSRPNGRLQTLR